MPPFSSLPPHTFTPYHLLTPTHSSHSSHLSRPCPTPSSHLSSSYSLENQLSFQKIANSSSLRQGFGGTIAAKAKQPLGDQDGYAVYMSNRFATKYVLGFSTQMVG